MVFSEYYPAASEFFKLNIYLFLVKQVVFLLSVTALALPDKCF